MLVSILLFLPFSWAMLKIFGITPAGRICSVAPMACCKAINAHGTNICHGNSCFMPLCRWDNQEYEICIEGGLSEITRVVQGMEQGPYRAVGEALEVIPRTLAQNCGANIIRTLTKLRAKHFDSSGDTFGIDGNTGTIFLKHQIRFVLSFESLSRLGTCSMWCKSVSEKAFISMQSLHK